MQEMLIINPAKRPSKRKARKARRKNPSAAQKANWARFARMARSRSAASNPKRRRARRNPATPVWSTNPKRRARRRNPVAAYRHARRRNPSLRSIGGSVTNLRSYMPALKTAAIQGAGAVGMDVLFGYVNRYLPASMQAIPGSPGIGTAVKMLLTIALGRVLAKPTRGMSNQAAIGSLTVQFRDLTMALLPASMSGPAAAVNGIGFYSAGRVVPGQQLRVGVNGRIANQVGMYRAGPTPLLSGAGTRGGVGMYRAGPTPLLSRAPMRR